MDYYYVNMNQQESGEHEVHKSSCYRLPNSNNRIGLGYFYYSADALKEAKKYYQNVDGCFYCSPEIHKK